MTTLCALCPSITLHETTLSSVLSSANATYITIIKVLLCIFQTLTHLNLVSIFICFGSCIISFSLFFYSSLLCTCVLSGLLAHTKNKEN
ncbi:hypothetical protein BDB00DRAFT_831701 [Zychaea mexicana]|uniref:uncharacterized protein n=1 Tax=Zychaea mexicana TaxID=64656 RepID=UPI0022FEA99C|nr:uncharacterized protein BDB00DRAFT_831701 [Zychaea mexicana]KAI9491679.1 hypothetical protein BDB00DRAFT_831701 [Zychaea mexicana]